MVLSVGVGCVASLAVCDRECFGIGVGSLLPKGDCGITGMGTLSLDIGIGCKGMKGVSNGEERAVGAAELTGEGATAGIILAEDMTVELPCVFPNAGACPAISPEDER